MKKLLYCAVALAGLFAAASCQQESLEPVAGGVTYEISLPTAMQTKGAEGYAEYDLYYQVFKTADKDKVATAPLLFEKKVTMTGNKTKVSLELLNDQDYTILFWANKAETDYVKSNSLAISSVQNDVVSSKSEDRETRTKAQEIININTADKQQLMTIKGIGEVKAEAIISYRESVGKFKSVEELLQVRGIGKATLEKIRDCIVAE